MGRGGGGERSWALVVTVDDVHKKLAIDDMQPNDTNPETRRRRNERVQNESDGMTSGRRFFFFQSFKSRRQWAKRRK